MNFDDILNKFKTSEQMEDILPITGKDAEAERLRKILIAWRKIEIKKTPTKTKPPEDEIALWNWLWKNVSFDEEQLKSIAGIRGNIQDSMNVLIGNRLIYPDGTISVFASKALKQLLKTQLKL